MTTSASEKHADQIPLRGGHLALDFVNTAGWHASDEPAEWLVSYDELARWGAHAGALTAREAQSLRRKAAQGGPHPARVLSQTLALREALFRTLRALVAGKSAAPVDLQLIAAEHSGAMSRVKLVRAGAGYAVGWPPGDALDLPRWKVAHAALELLTSPELERLRECGGHPCGWLFLDRSPNRSRRWCSSEECGNRERVRRFSGRR